MIARRSPIAAAEAPATRRPATRTALDRRRAKTRAAMVSNARSLVMNGYRGDERTPVGGWPSV